MENVQSSAQSSRGWKIVAKLIDTAELTTYESAEPIYIVYVQDAIGNNIAAKEAFGSGHLEKVIEEFEAEYSIEVKTKRTRRKKFELVLMNDEYNSSEYVIRLLSEIIPNCTTLRAEQLALIAHYNGECSLASGFQPGVYILYSQLVKSGLHVQIREVKRKSVKG